MWLVMLLLLSVVFMIVATTKLKGSPLLCVLEMLRIRDANCLVGIDSYEGDYCNGLVQRDSRQL